MAEIGTIRIKKNLLIVEKTKSGWKKSLKSFPEALQVVKLFKAEKRFKELIDQKNPQFLKGELVKGQIKGARINVLPNGEKLDKAYSLFAKHLRIHDQDSDDHWDVLYQNKGRTWNYGYTLEKKIKHREKKYQQVEEFNQIYQKLTRKVSSALKNEDDNLAVPVYTLLKTRMRVGNETYYKAHRHKGLTTLKKKNITIKNNLVKFDYLAKDGVPRLIEMTFPQIYVRRLKKIIKSLKKDDFVFTSKTGRPLPEREFKKAFLLYSGKEFYPHIVRSHFATQKVKSFLKGKRKLTKEQKNKLFLSIAAKLGHKRFVKKEQCWKDNYAVTVNHYVQPKLVKKVNSLLMK